MGMSGAQAEAVRLSTRRAASLALRTPKAGHNHQSRSLALRRCNEGRGLADMLLDSVRIPRVLPTQPATLIVLLKTQAASRREGLREGNDDPPLAA
jgi:hypothetical protein